MRSTTLISRDSAKCDYDALTASTVGCCYGVNLFVIRRARWFGGNGTAVDIENRKTDGTLRIAEKQTLEMIANDGSLKDILNHLCTCIDVQVWPSVTTILLMDPDGRRLWQGAGPLTPPEWIPVLNPVPVAPDAGLCGTAAFLNGAGHRQ